MGTQFADHLQLALFQADPGRVVGVGIDDGGDVAGRELFLQLRAEAFAAVGIDVEFLPADAEHPELGFLDREARVDEQDLVLPRDALGAGDEGAEGAGHGSRRGDAAERVDIDIDERLDETGGGLLELRHAVGGRILGADAPFQGLFLGLHAVAVRRQARGALVHADEGNARLPLQVLGHEQDFTDGGLRKVRDARGYTRLFDQFFTKDLHNRRRML